MKLHRRPRRPLTRASAAFLFISFCSELALLSRPAEAPLLLSIVTLASLWVWHEGNGDRRAQVLQGWAAAGLVGLCLSLGLLSWTALQPGKLPPPALYLTWAACLATLFGVTAWGITRPAQK